jgi:hypothetical protein
MRLSRSESTARAAITIRRAFPSKGRSRATGTSAQSCTAAPRATTSPRKWTLALRDDRANGRPMGDRRIQQYRPPLSERRALLRDGLQDVSRPFNYGADEVSAMRGTGRTASTRANRGTFHTPHGETRRPNMQCAIFSSPTPTFRWAPSCGRSGASGVRIRTGGPQTRDRSWPATDTWTSSPTERMRRCCRRPT